MSEIKNIRTETDRLIEEYLEYLEIERNCSPLTIRNYRHYLGRFSLWFKENISRSSLKNLNLEEVKKYRVFLARYTTPKETPLSRSTQSYHVIALRSFLKWLIKNDYPTLSPEKIELPKVESRSLKFLTTEQVERLLSQPRVSTSRGLRNKAILELLFSTGLRVSELVKLNRDQINLSGQEFGVIGKGGRSRVVFLSDSAVEWLKKYLDLRKDDNKALFLGNQNRLSVRTVQRIVKKYIKSSRIPVDATVHTLRHSFATDLLQAGADIRSVQEMLGHKNIATTQIYTHVTNKQLKQIHQTFHGRGR